VSVLSTTRGEQQLSLSGHRGAVRSAEFSIDGHYIVTASADRSVRVWAIKDGQPVFALQDLPQPPLSAELSADGKQLVILLADGEARLYSVSDRDFISAGCTKLRTMTTVPGCS
jgi:WD40 repeat protein